MKFSLVPWLPGSPWLVGWGGEKVAPSGTAGRGMFGRSWGSSWSLEKLITQHRWQQHKWKKRQSAKQRVQGLPSEKAMAPHSSTLAWKIPWMEEPGGLQSMGSTESLHLHFSFSCLGEGNGNPLQCSCLENPRDSGAWWAAIYEVAQSWTWLKWLSSSSSSSRDFLGGTGVKNPPCNAGDMGSIPTWGIKILHAIPLATKPSNHNCRAQVPQRRYPMLQLRPDAAKNKQ